MVPSASASTAATVTLYPLVYWEKSSATIFPEYRLRFRRQKAWLLPPGSSRGYARIHRRIVRPAHVTPANVALELRPPSTRPRIYKAGGVLANILPPCMD